MANLSYMTITGTTQGNISAGDNTADSIANSVQATPGSDVTLVYSFTHEVVVPRDPLSGVPTGTRLHQPASFTKQLSKSSPLLWNAITSGESLTLALTFWRINTSGQLENYFKIEWDSVTLVDAKGFKLDVQNKANADYFDMEEFKFTYKKVTWEHVKAGTNGSDDYGALKTA